MALALRGDFHPQLVEFGGKFVFASAQHFQLILRFAAALLEFFELLEVRRDFRFQATDAIRRLAVPCFTAGAFAFEVLLLTFGSAKRSFKSLLMSG